MPRARPLDIFIVAEQFRYAGKLATIIPPLVSTNPAAAPALAFARNLHMPTASMVCAAFALELYFKCLIRMGRKSFGREHDLAKLFRLVGRRNRVIIKRYWHDNSANVLAYIEREYQISDRPVPKVDFDFVLSASKDAFVVMRYIYEPGLKPDTGWLADVIVEAARRTILDKHPDWERAHQTSPLPEASFQSTTPS